MRCPECSADVPPLREYCPNCGASTDPEVARRRREAQRGRSEEELRSNRKKFLIGGGVVLLALAAMGKITLPGPAIHIDTDDERRGPAVVEAQQIYDAYREDGDAAAKRFADREMVVSGEFLRIVPDGYGSLDMRLKTSNPEVQLGVDLAGIAIEDAKKLRPGQRVTVSCQRMRGDADDPWLQDCAIQPTREEDPAAPSPPAPPPPPSQ